MGPGPDFVATAARPENADTRTAAGARLALTREFRAAGIDSPELDARLLVAHALGLDHAATRGGRRPCPRPRRNRRNRRAGAAASAARAGGAHPRQQGILESEAARRCCNAGAAAGNRNGRRSGARRARRRWCAVAFTADCRSRHRLRRPAAGAVDRAAALERHRHRYQFRCACRCPRQRPNACD